MGIESDQLVFDYLSRVGDLAQQAQLPSGARMRLVTTLRSEIERRRTGVGGNTPAGVRRILGRLGTPDEVVAAAAEDGGGAPPTAPPASVPRPAEAADESPAPRPRLRLRAPRPRTPDAPPPPPAASPPHLAGMDELGPSGSEPDWWRIDPGPFGPGDRVAGFVGGVEVPEILRPPREEESEAAEEEPDATEGADAGDEAAVRRRWRPRVRLRRRAEAVPEAAPDGGRGFGHPMLLLGAALLLGGAVFGSLIPLAGGWLIAYGSRRLNPTQTKIALFVIPGASVAGGLLWLWGRVNGRWGEPVPEDAMREALLGTWPWVLKGAAVATALYLLWRARTVRGA
ncbi:hypothetical protein [Streptomyces sp. t39]|uniref:hypothetical protein n=1 Tax=Streptomyces sp. t39 TaxID=1828156 RepID=UPI0011CE5511|nr:hypothetical protein [Streptomyces sp. t39]TXS55708.1 hypothetical protein EAO77_05710 [Streptomyces sp. t39]